MAKAGSIEIDVKLNATPLERQLAREKVKLEKYEKEGIELQAKREANDEVLRQYQQEVEALRQEYLEIQRTAVAEHEKKALLESSESSLQQINAKYSSQVALQKELNNKIKQNAKNQEIVKNKIIQTEKEVGKSEGWKNIPTHLENANKSLSKTIKKVGKYALAVFGVRSAYMAVRSAMGILTQYDDQLTADLEYIKYAIATALKPVIEWIVNAVKSLMYYAGYIAKSWFNIDLFANSSAKGMAKASQGAKEMKKSLAGFDTANVLADDTTAGGGGTVGPSFDASEWDFTKAEELQDNFIEKSKNDWLELEETMRGALDDPEAMEEAFGNWDTFMAGLINIFLGAYDIIKGVIEIIIGIIKMIVGVFTGDFELIEEGWEDLKDGIVDILYGLVEIIVGVLQALWGVIKGLFLDLVEGIYETVIKPIGQFFVDLWNGIVDAAKTAWEGIKEVFSKVAEFFKDIFSKAWEGVKKVFSSGGKIFTGIKDGIVDAFKRVVNVLISGINKVVAIPFNAINKMLNKIRNVSILGVSPFKGFWGENPLKVPQIPKLAVGGIVDVPKRGVNIGGAIAGEAGREGVLPLTNPNTMAELGKEIGKWITINLDLTNSLDGRVLNKRLETIRANEEFARNRG